MSGEDHPGTSTSRKRSSSGEDPPPAGRMRTSPPPPLPLPHPPEVSSSELQLCLSLGDSANASTSSSTGNLVPGDGLASRLFNSDDMSTRLQLSLTVGDPVISTLRQLEPVAGSASSRLLSVPHGDGAKSTLSTSLSSRHEVPVAGLPSSTLSRAFSEGPCVMNRNPAEWMEIWLIRDVRMSAAWATITPLELCAQYHPSNVAWQNLTSLEKMLFGSVALKLKMMLKQYVESHALPMPMANEIEVFCFEFAKGHVGEEDLVGKAMKAWDILPQSKKNEFKKIKIWNDRRVEDHIFNNPPIAYGSFSYFIKELD